MHLKLEILLKLVLFLKVFYNFHSFTSSYILAYPAILGRCKNPKFFLCSMNNWHLRLVKITDGKSYLNSLPQYWAKIFTKTTRILIPHAISNLYRWKVNFRLQWNIFGFEFQHDVNAWILGVLAQQWWRCWRDIRHLTNSSPWRLFSKSSPASSPFTIYPANAHQKHRSFLRSHFRRIVRKDRVPYCWGSIHFANMRNFKIFWKNFLNQRDSYCHPTAWAFHK